MCTVSILWVPTHSNVSNLLSDRLSQTPNVSINLIMIFKDTIRIQTETKHFSKSKNVFVC